MTINWRTTGAALVAGLALISAACVAPPELNDRAPAKGGRPEANAPTTSRPAPPTTKPPVAGPSGTYAAHATRSEIGGCTIFPPDHFLNATNVDRLPVHPSSSAWTAFLDRDGARLNVPGTGVWDGSRGGMPFNIVDSRSTSMSRVVLNPNYISHSRQHTGGYPIPKHPLVEGHPTPQWDRHLLIVDVADCTAYELIQYDPLLGALGFHAALAGTKYSLDTADHPKLVTTNAASTPMIGQYAMADEVRAGELAHVIGWCTDALAKGHVWPARSGDGRLDRPDAPPMGAWLRLRGDVDLSRYSGQALTIARALRNHGMVLTDTCGHRFGIMVENSNKWNDAELAQLRSLTPRDFEFVDTTPMRASSSSFRVN